jgi:hypothetical protein
MCAPIDTGHRTVVPHGGFSGRSLCSVALSCLWRALTNTIRFRRTIGRVEILTQQTEVSSFMIEGFTFLEWKAC